MSLFWLEYFHYIAAALAILVSVSAFALFLLTYRYEKQLQTAWRAIGFLLLGVAFFLFILERKWGGVGLPAIIISTIAFFSIYKGVLAEPKLSQLQEYKKVKVKEAPRLLGSMFELFGLGMKNYAVHLLVILILIALFGVAYLIFPALAAVVGSYFASVFELAALIFILLTIRIQIRRYRSEKNSAAVQRQNLWPLIGYIFLVVRGAGLIFYRLPELNLVWLHNLRLDFSLAWQLGVFGTLLAFLFLGVWAWNFIKLRPFLRTYVDFLTMTIIVSTLGSLVFTVLIFQVVERNNLKLMAQGAETQQLLMEDRMNVAMFVAQTMANDIGIMEETQKDEYQSLLTKSNSYLHNSTLDILRVYNKYGEVVVSPSDERDRGRVFDKDPLVAYVISEQKVVKSFEVQDGVLAPVVIARSLYPMMLYGNLVGVVETGYVFDNAFVDYSKEKTGLEVTIFAGKKRSATTLLTIDGVSRWVGTEETDTEVLQSIFGAAVGYRTTVDRLGETYYSAFEPITNVNGKIIGMVAVGTPTQALFQDARQQLISSFIIVTIISLLVAFGGYYLLTGSRKKADGLFS